MRALAVLITCGALLVACEESPCSDGTEPAEGSCTCADGQQVAQSECDLCEGVPTDVSLGQIEENSTSKQGKANNLCFATYTFETDENGALELALSDTSGTVTAKILPTSEGMPLKTVTVGANSSANDDVNLPAGSYLVSVEGPAGGSAFELELSLHPYETDAPIGDPSDDPDEPFSIGTLDGVQTVGEVVGGSDAADFYSFDLVENAVVSYAVRDVSGRVQAHLYRNEGLFNADKYIDVIDTSTELTHSLNLEKGPYLVRLTGVGESSLYTLSADAELYEPYEPGEDPGDDDEPYDLGTLDKLVDELGGYVGVTDSEDFYAFELEDDNTVTFAVENVLGRVIFQLYEQSSIFAQDDYVSYLDVATDAVSEPIALSAGKYLVRITPQNAGVGSLYELAFSPGD